MTKAFLHGFLEKCAESGVQPHDGLYKAALFWDRVFAAGIPASIGALAGGAGGYLLEGDKKKKKKKALIGALIGATYGGAGGLLATRKTLNKYDKIDKELRALGFKHGIKNVKDKNIVIKDKDGNTVRPFEYIVARNPDAEDVTNRKNFVTNNAWHRALSAFSPTKLKRKSDDKLLKKVTDAADNYRTNVKKLEEELERKLTKDEQNGLRQHVINF